MIEGKWDDENFKSTYTVNGNQEIDLSKGYTSEIFQVFLDSADKYIAIEEIAKSIGKGEALVKANIESLKEVLLGSSVKLVTNTFGYKLEEKVEPPSVIKKPKEKNPFIRNYTIPEERKVGPIGIFSDDFKTLILDKSSKTIPFHRPSIGRFFDVLQNAGSTHVTFDYLFKKYNQISYQTISSIYTIENAISGIQKILRRNGINNIKFHIYRREELIVLEYLNETEV
jgi:biotin operon repressor